MHKYLDPVVKADQYDQNVQDIGIALNNATGLDGNIPVVFNCSRQAGLKLTIEKCHLGFIQVDLRGRTISPERVSLQARKIQIFLGQFRFSRTKKGLQRYLCFLIYHKNFNPKIVEKLSPFYKLLKAKAPININSELKKTIDSVNNAPSNACELILKQPIPQKKIVVMTDASFRSHFYALMIEINPHQKIQ